MSPTLNERCPEQQPDITESQVEDEIVLFDPRVDAAHILNPTAALVWWLCDGTKKPTQIVEEVANLIEDPPDSLDKDVRETINGFSSLNLVQWR